MKESNTGQRKLLEIARNYILLIFNELSRGGGGFFEEDLNRIIWLFK